MSLCVSEVEATVSDCMLHYTVTHETELLVWIDKMSCYQPYLPNPDNNMFNLQSAGASHICGFMHSNNVYYVRHNEHTNHKRHDFCDFHLGYSRIII